MNPRVSPLLPFASAFVCGILCADAGAGAWGLAVSAALGLAAMFARRSLAGSLLLGLALGIAASLAHPPAMMPEGTAGAADVWEGTAEAVREKGNATQLTVAVRARGGHPCPPFKAKVMAYGEALGDKAGWDVRFKGRMKPLENRSGIPLEPDPDKFLRLQGVTAVCHVTEDNLEVTGPGSGTRAAFSRLRTSTGRLIDGMGLRLATAEFLRAALLAEGHVIEPETRGLFGRAGIAHLLALSGIHVAVITLMLWICCLPLTAAGLWRTRVAVVIAGLWCFALLTGLTPSVTRAAAMTSVLLLATVFYRSADVMNSLCASALLILAANPGALYQPGFQMSFLAVLAIILYVMPVQEMHLPLGDFRGLFHSALLCVAAFAATGAVAAAWFGELHLTSIAANLVASAAMAPLLACGIAGLALASVGVSPGWLSWLADRLYGIMEWSAETFGGHTIGIPDGMAIPLWAVICYVGAFLLAGFGVRYRSRTAAAAGAMAMAATAAAFLLFPVRLPAEGVWICGDAEATDIAVCRGGVLTIHSDLPHDGAGRRLETYRWRFARYMAAAGIDSLRIRHAAEHFMVSHGRRRMVVVPAGETGAADTLWRGADYLLVGRGFKGDIAALAASYEADSVILGTDIHPLRRERYLGELDRCGRRARTLGEGPLRLTP